MANRAPTRHRPHGRGQVLESTALALLVDYHRKVGACHLDGTRHRAQLLPYATWGAVQRDSVIDQCLSHAGAAAVLTEGGARESVVTGATITRRSQVQILPPLPFRSPVTSGAFRLESKLAMSLCPRLAHEGIHGGV
jgi:hypothetical protein